MTVKTKTVGAVVALVGAATVVTMFNNFDEFRGFINVTQQTERNYDDGSETVTVRLTWGKGQLAEGRIQVNGQDYLKGAQKHLDNITGRSAPTWTLHPNRGDEISAVVIPHVTSSGSSCSIIDPKHPEMIKEPAVTANLIGGSNCHYTVLG